MLATERLVAAKGFDGVSVRDIAAEAGANLSAISYHFVSKTRLVVSTLDWRGLQGVAMRERQLAGFEAQETIEDVRGLLSAILECHFNRPSSPGQPTHMFFQRLFIDPTPEVMDFFHDASVWFRKDVYLLQRARPEISFEDACWRYYAIMALTHLNDFDGARLRASSDGRCNPDDRPFAFNLIVDSAMAILTMPPRDDKTR
ncbi:MAG: TetR/AcrR family transcriptional regulator [Sphingobium sp.]|nr:TetR/AcrR family transcriptional regulator [Sphingobium sp.]